MTAKVNANLTLEMENVTANVTTKSESAAIGDWVSRLASGASETVGEALASYKRLVKHLNDSSLQVTFSSSITYTYIRTRGQWPYRSAGIGCYEM